MSWKQGNPGCECCEESIPDPLICGCLGPDLLATITLDINSDTGQYKRFSNGGLSLVSDLLSLEATYGLTIPISDPCTNENAPYLNSSITYEPSVGYEDWTAPSGVSGCTPISLVSARDFYKFPVTLDCTSSILSLTIGWRFGYDTVSPSPKFSIRWGTFFSVDLKCDANLVLPYTQTQDIVYVDNIALCLTPTILGTARLDITAIIP